MPNQNAIRKYRVKKDFYFKRRYDPAHPARDTIFLTSEEYDQFPMKQHIELISSPEEQEAVESIFNSIPELEPEPEPKGRKKARVTDKDVI